MCLGKTYLVVLFIPTHLGKLEMAVKNEVLIQVYKHTNKYTSTNTHTHKD